MSARRTSLQFSTLVAAFKSTASAVHSGLVGVARGQGPWRIARFLAWLFGATAIVGGVAFAALMMRLASGPIDISDVGKRISESLSNRTGLQVTFGATQISRTELGPTIEVARLSASVNGKVVITAPRARVSLDPISLLKFEPRPRWIDALNLDIKIVVNQDGQVAFSASDEAQDPIVLPKGADHVSPRPPKIVEQALPDSAILREATGALRDFIDFATGRDNALGGLRHIGVTQGRLTVEDLRVGRVNRYSDVEMALDKSSGKASFALRGQSANGPLAALAAAQASHGGQRVLEIELRDISIDDINLAAGLKQPFIDTDSRINAHSRFVVDADGALADAGARFAFSPGFLRLDDPDHEPLFYNEISGALKWDPAAKKLDIESIRYFAGETQFSLGGFIAPPADTKEGLQVTLGLLEPGGFAGERPGEKFIAVTQAHVDGVYFGDAGRIDIHEIKLGGPEFSLKGHGVATLGEAPVLNLNLTAGQSNAPTMIRLMPTTIAASARAWMLSHIRAGAITSGEAALRIDKDTVFAMRRDLPPPDDAIALKFSFAGGVINAAAGTPDISNIAGAGRITGSTTNVMSQSGRIQFKSERAIQLSDLLFSIPKNLGEKATPAFVEGRAQGSVDAIGELLDEDAISPHASLPLEAGMLKGVADGKVRLDFKIGPDARKEDIKVSVNANVTNFVVEKLVGKEKFEAPTLTIIGNSQGLQASGAGRIFGTNAQLDLKKMVGQPAQAQMSATIDDAARTRAGLSIPGVSGPIAAKLTATVVEKTKKANVEIDLTRTALDNPAPGVVKPAGKPGRATFAVTQKDNGLRLDDLNLDAGALQARGSIDLTSTGDLVAARLTNVRLSAGDDVRVDAQKSGEGYKLIVRGGSLDARPFLKSLTQVGEKSGREAADFDLDLKTPILSGYGRQQLLNADFKITRRGGAVRNISLSGGLGKTPVAVAMTRGEGAGNQVSIATGNAGALLAFTDLYARMEGGELYSTLQLEPRAMTGHVQIKNFYLRDEPALKKLVFEGATRGDSARKIDGGLVHFDRLQTTFTRSGGRIELREGTMSSQEIGLTVEGAIDEARDALNLNGTFIPAFAINNFFAKIPVVGMLLTGGWNEGLVAINYRVTGKFSAPQLTVNPLSAVTPGVLRKIFGAIDGAATGANQR